MFDINKKKHKSRNINRITLIRKKTQGEIKMAKRRKAKKKGKKKAKKRRR